MKRHELIRHLKRHGCYLLREGGNHSIYVNPDGNRVSSVPRHSEINEHMARKICRDLDIRETRSRVDSVTGSMEWQTTWPLGITAGPRVDASPLELRLINMGVQWKRKWTFLHNTHRNLFGDASMFECGFAPPIYQLRPMLGDFVAISTDEEIRQFVQIMQTGADDDTSSAVLAATEQVFASP